jgi:hypothetical protein
MGPEKRPNIPASIDAGDVDAKSLPMPPSRFLSNIPGIRRRRGRFDGGLPSPRSESRTKFLFAETAGSSFHGNDFKRSSVETA